MTDAQNALKLKVGLVFSKTEEMRNFNKRIAELQDSLKGVNLDKALGFKNVGSGAEDAGKKIKKTSGIVGEFFTKLKNQAKNLAVFSVLSGGLLFLTTRLRDAVQVVSELDKAYTNFAIVTGATADETARMDAEATKLTATLGRLKKEIIDSITEFSRAGYSIEDSMTLANSAIIGANVGFTDLSNVTNYLIAGLKSFKLEAEDSTRVIDTLFQVSNKTAIDFEGIGEAFLRSANTLQVAGASMEQTTALISAANETILDANKVGTALKTIAARLRGVGDEGEVIPTLARDFKAVGIELQNADGSFRNIYDVFRDFANVYKDLDDLTKQSLVEKIAGKRQANIFIGLIENFDVAEMALTEGLNSIGAAAEANERYLESIEGRVKTLQNAVNEFYTQLMSSDAIKLFISAITGLVKALTLLTNGITGTIVGLGLLSFSANALYITLIGLKVGMMTVFPVLGIITGAVIAFTSVTDLASDSTKSLTKKLGDLNAEITSLDSKIANLKAIEDRTDAEDKLLEVLEKKLEVEKRLRDITNQSIASNLLVDVEKSIAAINNQLEMYEALSVEDIMSESAESIAKASEKIKGYETDLLSMQQSALESLSATKEGTQANLDAQKAYDSASISLERLKNLQYTLGFEIRNTTNETKSQISEQQKLNDLLGIARSNISGAVDNYQLLTDAIDQMVDSGRLEQQTFNALKETYPQLISVLGENEDAFIGYASTLRNESRSVTSGLLADLIAQQSIYQQQIDNFDALQSRISSDPIFGNMLGADKIGASIGDSANKNLKDINAVIAEVTNTLKLYDNVLDTSSKRNNTSNKTTEKTIVLLTEEEKIVRDLNQQIALKQALYSRTEGEQNQININKELIELQKQLKQALINQKNAYIDSNKSLQEGTEEYEDYIANVYKMSLGIEEATNVIYSLEKANIDLTKSIIEASQKIAEDEISKAVDKINQTIADQISEINKLKDASDDYYDGLIDQKEAEIKAYEDANELVDEQIRLQEALQLLEDARERKRNILANRNVRLVQNANVGFEWVADPREIKKVNEEIVEAEKNVDKVRQELNRNATIRRLEMEKDELEKSKQLASENYEAQILLLENFENESQRIIDEGGKLTWGIVTTLMDNLKSTEATSYADRLSGLYSFISSYNAAMSSLTLSNATLSTLPTTSPTSNAPLTTNNPTINSSGGSKLTTPTSNTLSKAIVGNTTNKSNQTNIGTINVKSDAKTVDMLLKDVNSKTKVYDPRITLY